jgi:hypothetical protein
MLGTVATIHMHQRRTAVLTLSVSAVTAQPAATHTTATGVTWKSVVEETAVQPLPFELALLHAL